MGEIHQRLRKPHISWSSSKTGETLAGSNDDRQKAKEILSADGPVARIFSIGYEGKQIDAFIGILKRNGVERLIDVRQAPFSRKPGFSKRALEKELKEKGIEYVGIMELGTDKESRDRHKADGDMAEVLKEYRAKLERNIEKYELLKRLAGERVSCIMCYEEDFRECHRQVIEERMEADGFRVVHLEDSWYTRL